MHYRLFFFALIIALSFSVFFQREIAAQVEAPFTVDRAARFEKEGRLAEAVAVYLEILKQTPERAAVYNNLGADYFELGRYPEAVAALRRAIELDPHDARAFYNLGVVLDHLGRKAEAAAALQTAVRLDPRSAAARAKLCDALLGSARETAAVGCYEELLARGGFADAQSRSNYGVALMRSGRLKQAVAAFEQNVRLFAPNAETLNNLGVALLELGRFAGAVAALRSAVALEPESDAMRYNLAVAELAAKNKSAALEHYSFLKRRDETLARRLFERIYKGKIISAAGR